MGSRRRYQKRKAAARASATSEAAGDSVPVLKRRKNNVPIVSESVSDETKILKLEEACPSEEGKILKLKKEFMAANEVSGARIPIPFFTEGDEAAPALAQPDGKTTMRTKKTKKVLIKRVVPTRVIESFKERLFTIIPDECILTDDELAKHSQQFQESYAENMDLMTKMRAWQTALLEQYDRFGYAVDESEADVTDGEDDDDHVRNSNDDGVERTEREKTGGSSSKEKSKKKAVSRVAPGTVLGPEDGARPKRARKPNPRNVGPEWQRP